MEQNKKKKNGRYIQYGTVAVFWVFILYAYLFNFTPGKAIAHSFGAYAGEMAMVLPMMFILVGLFDVWVPKQAVMRHIGKGSGVKGMGLVILLAMFQAGPLYGAFPVAAILWKKGCTPFNIFVYIGAFSVMKIPMLTFEVGFLGWKFSLLRLLFALPVTIISAAILDLLIPSKMFSVVDAHSEELKS